MRNNYDYKVDVFLGIVYGIKGLPITRKDKQGYVVIRRRGFSQRMAHRIIWEHVHGELPAGLEINHINGIKDDNRIDNLEAVTRAENMKHAHKIGLASNLGDRNPNAKLNVQDVLEIKAKISEGASRKEIARCYGVAVGTLNHAIAGRTWKHLA